MSSLRGAFHNRGLQRKFFLYIRQERWYCVQRKLQSHPNTNSERTASSTAVSNLLFAIILLVLLGNEELQ